MGFFHITGKYLEYFPCCPLYGVYYKVKTYHPGYFYHVIAYGVALQDTCGGFGN